MHLLLLDTSLPWVTEKREGTRTQIGEASPSAVAPTPPLSTSSIRTAVVVETGPGHNGRQREKEQTKWRQRQKQPMAGYPTLRVPREYQTTKGLGILCETKNTRGRKASRNALNTNRMF